MGGVPWRFQKGGWPTRLRRPWYGVANYKPENLAPGSASCSLIGSSISSPSQPDGRVQHVRVLHSLPNSHLILHACSNSTNMPRIPRKPGGIKPRSSLVVSPGAEKDENDMLNCGLLIDDILTNNATRNGATRNGITKEIIEREYTWSGPVRGLIDPSQREQNVFITYEGEQASAILSSMVMLLTGNDYLPRM